MFKVLDEVCKPTKGSKYSAAVDLYAKEDVVIGAGETVKVPLGVCIDMKEIQSYVFNKMNELGYEIDARDYYLNDFLARHYMQLEPRSSLRAKGLIAGTGIIDLDYKDEIMIILHNPNYIMLSENKQSGDMWIKDLKKDFKISKGDKIAQILLKEHKTYLMGIDTEEERKGGFGSTGK